MTQSLNKHKQGLEIKRLLSVYFVAFKILDSANPEKTK